MWGCAPVTFGYSVIAFAWKQVRQLYCVKIVRQFMMGEGAVARCRFFKFDINFTILWIVLSSCISISMSLIVNLFGEPPPLG